MNEPDPKPPPPAAPNCTECAPGSHPSSADLSDREAEVVRLIALGYSNKEIAARLALSVKTVETYKVRALAKLKLRSRVDVVRYAARRGWFEGL